MKTSRNRKPIYVSKFFTRQDETNPKPEFADPHEQVRAIQSRIYPCEEFEAFASQVYAELCLLDQPQLPKKSNLTAATTFGVMRCRDGSGPEGLKCKSCDEEGKTAQICIDHTAAFKDQAETLVTKENNAGNKSELQSRVQVERKEEQSVSTRRSSQIGHSTFKNHSLVEIRNNDFVIANYKKNTSTIGSKEDSLIAHSSISKGLTFTSPASVEPTKSDSKDMYPQTFDSYVSDVATLKSDCKDIHSRTFDSFISEDNSSFGFIFEDRLKNYSTMGDKSRSSVPLEIPIHSLSNFHPLKSPRENTRAAPCLHHSSSFKCGRVNPVKTKSSVSLLNDPPDIVPSITFSASIMSVEGKKHSATGNADASKPSNNVTGNLPITVVENAPKLPKRRKSQSDVDQSGHRKCRIRRASSSLAENGLNCKPVYRDIVDDGVFKKLVEVVNFEDRSRRTGTIFKHGILTYSNLTPPFEESKSEEVVSGAGRIVEPKWKRKRRAASKPMVKNRVDNLNEEEELISESKVTRNHTIRSKSAVNHEEEEAGIVFELKRGEIGVDCVVVDVKDKEMLFQNEDLNGSTLIFESNVKRKHRIASKSVVNHEEEEVVNVFEVKRDEIGANCVVVAVKDEEVLFRNEYLNSSALIFESYVKRNRIIRSKTVANHEEEEVENVFEVKRGENGYNCAVVHAKDDEMLLQNEDLNNSTQSNNAIEGIAFKDSKTDAVNEEEEYVNSVMCKTKVETKHRVNSEHEDAKDQLNVNAHTLVTKNAVATFEREIKSGVLGKIGGEKLKKESKSSRSNEDQSKKISKSSVSGVKIDEKFEKNFESSVFQVKNDDGKLKEKTKSSVSGLTIDEKFEEKIQSTMFEVQINDDKLKKKTKPSVSGVKIDEKLRKKIQSSMLEVKVNNDKLKKKAKSRVSGLKIYEFHLKNNEDKLNNKTKSNASGLKIDEKLEKPMQSGVFEVKNNKDKLKKNTKSSVSRVKIDDKLENKIQSSIYEVKNDEDNLRKNKIKSSIFKLKNEHNLRKKTKSGVSGLNIDEKLEKKIQSSLFEVKNDEGKLKKKTKFGVSGVKIDQQLENKTQSIHCRTMDGDAKSQLKLNKFVVKNEGENLRVKLESSMPGVKINDEKSQMGIDMLNGNLKKESKAKTSAFKKNEDENLELKIPGMKIDTETLDMKINKAAVPSLKCETGKSRGCHGDEKLAMKIASGVAEVKIEADNTDSVNVDTAKYVLKNEVEKSGLNVVTCYSTMTGEDIEAKSVGKKEYEKLNVVTSYSLKNAGKKEGEKSGFNVVNNYPIINEEYVEVKSVVKKKDVMLESNYSLLPAHHSVMLVEDMNVQVRHPEDETLDLKYASIVAVNIEDTVVRCCKSVVKNEDEKSGVKIVLSDSVTTNEDVENLLKIKAEKCVVKNTVEGELQMKSFHSRIFGEGTNVQVSPPEDATLYLKRASSVAVKIGDEKKDLLNVKPVKSAVKNEDEKLGLKMVSNGSVTIDEDVEDLSKVKAKKCVIKNTVDAQLKNQSLPSGMFNEDTIVQVSPPEDTKLDMKCTPSVAVKIEDKRKYLLGVEAKKSAAKKVCGEKHWLYVETGKSAVKSEDTSGLKTVPSYFAIINEDEKKHFLNFEADKYTVKNEYEKKHLLNVEADTSAVKNEDEKIHFLNFEFYQSAMKNEDKKSFLHFEADKSEVKNEDGKIHFLNFKADNSAVNDNYAKKHLLNAEGDKTAVKNENENIHFLSFETDKSALYVETRKSAGNNEDEKHFLNFEADKSAVKNKCEKKHLLNVEAEKSAVKNEDEKSGLKTVSSSCAIINEDSEHCLTIKAGQFVANKEGEMMEPNIKFSLSGVVDEKLDRKTKPTHSTKVHEDAKGQLKVKAVKHEEMKIDFINIKAINSETISDDLNNLLKVKTGKLSEKNQRDKLVMKGNSILEDEGVKFARTVIKRENQSQLIKIENTGDMKINELKDTENIEPPHTRNHSINELKEVNTNSIKTEFKVWEPPGSQKPLWRPPKSPHNLIEESLYDNPWGLLVATIFLNKTSCEKAYPYIRQFLRDYKDPREVLQVKPSALERYFTNIGLVKRSVQVWRMSHDFVNKRWKDVGELHGIGKYGRDAFEMFCLGNMDVEPNDRFLRIYKAWFKMFQDKR